MDEWERFIEDNLWDIVELLQALQATSQNVFITEDVVNSCPGLKEYLDAAADLVHIINDKLGDIT